MNKNRYAKRLAIAAGFIFMFTGSDLAHAQSTTPSAAQTPRAVLPGAQPKTDALPQDDFAGLNYTDEQRAAIDKIHQYSESHKAAVVKDQQLTEDQKNAMLVGYTRMEYGWIFKALTPDQQRQVRQRVLARRRADQAAQKKQPPQK